VCGKPESHFGFGFMKIASNCAASYFCIAFSGKLQFRHTCGEKQCSEFMYCYMYAMIFALAVIATKLKTRVLLEACIFNCSAIQTKSKCFTLTSGHIIEDCVCVLAAGT